MTKTNQCIRVGVFSDILTEVPSFPSRPLLTFSFSLRFTIEAFSRFASSSPIALVRRLLPYIPVFFPLGADILRVTMSALTHGRIVPGKKPARAASKWFLLLSLRHLAARAAFVSPIRKDRRRVHQLGLYKYRNKEDNRRCQLSNGQFFRSQKQREREREREIERWGPWR